MDLSVVPGLVHPEGTDLQVLQDINESTGMVVVWMG